MKLTFLTISAIGIHSQIVKSYLIKFKTHSGKSYEQNYQQNKTNSPTRFLTLFGKNSITMGMAFFLFKRFSMEFALT
jgi:hypothetical protein